MNVVRRLPRPHHQPRAALAGRRGVGPLRRRRAHGRLPRRRQPGAGAGPAGGRPVFAERALDRGRTVSTIVGPQAAVRSLLGRRLRRRGAARARSAGTSRTSRSAGPAGRARPAGAADDARPTSTEVYPACVAMYTEEVGVSPEYGGGGDLYRARVSQLISRGWSFARFDGRPARLQGRGRLRDAVRRPGAGRLGAARPAGRGPRRRRHGGGRRAGPARGRAGRVALRQRVEPPGPPGLRAGRASGRRPRFATVMF